jgi:hypothetical protein
MLARRCRSVSRLLPALLFSATSLAHPFAVSEFDAKTDGRALVFSFRFDTTSVVDLVNRARPGAAPVGLEDLTLQREIVERYVNARFSVSNDGAACKNEGFRRYELDPGKARVLVELRFVCPHDLRTLELKSSLFQDETTPHQIVGNLTHKSALERYFFTGGERVATIKLDELRQGVRPALPSLSGVHIAAPPPGVRWGKPRNETAAAPSSAPAPCQGSSCKEAPAAQTIPARPWFVRSRVLVGGLVLVLLLGGLALARFRRLGRRVA